MSPLMEVHRPQYEQGLLNEIAKHRYASLWLAFHLPTAYQVRRHRRFRVLRATVCSDLAPLEGELFVLLSGKAG
jgi:hypothetical protein